MAIQTIEILKNYMTCEDEAVRNKYYNLLDSFYHKSEGKILHSITEDGNAITLQFTDGNSATANTSVVIPKLPNSQNISFINGLQNALNNKVDKVLGERLTEQNYTLAEKQKLSGLANYVKPNSEAISYINGLQAALDNKVSVEAGKGLSTNDFTDALKAKLEGLDSDNYSRLLVSSSRNLANTDNNKTLIINGTVTLTFPSIIKEDFNFNFKVKLNSTLTIANGGKTLLDTTETAQTQIVAEASTFGTVYQFDTNTFIVEGI